MRRTFTILGLLTLCMLCHCKRPTPPDESRVARSTAAATVREH